MMKKIVVIIILVIAAVAGTEAYGQSQISFGDKSIREIKKSNKVFNKQINKYYNEIDDLEQKNNRLLALLISSSDSSKFQVINNQIKLNNNRIDSYNDKIYELTNAHNIFIINATSKDETEDVKLKGNAEAVADAYAVIEYSKNNQQKDSLKGIIINYWNELVFVTVTGPGNFFRGTDLSANGGEFIFNIPGPGTYLTVFESAYDRKAIQKKTGGNIGYYHKGKKYDYMVLLPER
ncbi:MAG: hypothetical protein WC545_01725 [Patescibacteria group bacterium]|jgi:hypothetical protein